MTLVRIDLSEQLGANQYVEIRNPKMLPWGVQRDLQSALKDESIDSQIAFAEKLAVVLIKNGNVNDEDNNPISFPLSAEGVAQLPAIVVEEVAKKFAEIRSKGADIPKQ